TTADHFLPIHSSSLSRGGSYQFSANTDFEGACRNPACGLHRSTIPNVWGLPPPLRSEYNNLQVMQRAAPLVSPLFGLRCPANVTRLVVVVIVDSIKSHVGERFGPRAPTKLVRRR